MLTFSSIVGVEDLSVPDDGSLEHSVHAEDGGLGRVDDWSPEQGTEHATVTEMSVSQC